MQDCHWTADEIVKKINSGEKSTASGMLQSEMNKLRENPKEFKSLVDRMVSLTKDDGDEWNNVKYEVDGKGEITSVTIDDAYGSVFDTRLARKGAPTPISFIASINHDCTINK